MSAFSFQTVPTCTSNRAWPAVLPLLRERHAGERAVVVTDAFLYHSGALGPALKAWPPPAGKPWSSMMWSPIRRRRS